MKIWKKRMAMMLMLLCLFLMAGLTVSAAGSRVLRLRNGRTYRADLDGNGKKEKIQLQYYMVGDNCFRMRIYINDRLKLNTLVRDSLDCIWEVKACLLDYNRRDRYKEIYFENNAMSGSLSIHMYRYIGGRLKRVAYAAEMHPVGGDYGSLKNVQPGNGTLTFTGSLYGYAPAEVIGEYSAVIRGGRLRQKSYTCTAYRQQRYRLSVNKRATRSLNGGGAFTVRAWQRFQVQKVYRTSRQCKLYIRLSNGRKGWIQMANWENTLQAA